MDPLVAVPLVAGLMGSAHCVGMCGPFACAAAGVRPAHLAAWHAGRALTYTSLGALAGGFGAAVPGPAWVTGAVGAVLLVGYASTLAGLVPEPHVRIPYVGRAAALLTRRSGIGSRLLFGAVNGLLPCGLVWATLAVPVALGSPALGALVMMAFALATVPALTAWAVGARRITSRSPTARRVLAVLVLATGLWSVGVRSGMTATPSPGGTPPCHASP